MPDHNIIAIGDPVSNLWLAGQYKTEEARRLPVQFGGFAGADDTFAFAVGGCRWGSGQRAEEKPDRVGLLALVPRLDVRPASTDDRRVALILSGGRSVEALRDVVQLGTPTIPPMLRPPYTNLVPDFLVTGPDVARHGMGGYAQAGYFGPDWDYRPETSYSTKRCR
jgi:hypothetical protein